MQLFHFHFALTVQQPERILFVLLSDILISVLTKKPRNHHTSSWGLLSMEGRFDTNPFSNSSYLPACDLLPKLSPCSRKNDSHSQFIYLYYWYKMCTLPSPLRKCLYFQSQAKIEFLHLSDKTTEKSSLEGTSESVQPNPLLKAG